MHRYLTGVVAAGGWALACTAVQARPAECLLVINNRPLIDGRCELDPGPDGSFRMESSGFIGHVMVTKPGVGDGMWTQKPEVRSNYKDVNGLRRSGGCWSSGNNSFCAWAIGQRPQAQGDAAQAVAPSPRVAQNAPPRSGPPPRLGREFANPVAVRTAKSSGSQAEIRCTYYQDFMVREPLVGPMTGDASIVTPGAGASCDAGPDSGGQIVRTRGYGFKGKVSKFLFFDGLLGRGLNYFRVVDAETGRALFDDASIDNSFPRAAEMRRDGSLRLRYTRGIVADCSLLVDAQGCWARIVALKKLPPALVGAAPSGDICAAAYEHGLKGKAPDDQPSIVSYELTITIGLDGEADLESRGPLRCTPAP